MKVNKIIKTTVEEELEITGATLLSIEEAEEYLTVEERKYDYWWWLRSPGFYSYFATYVTHGDYNGYYVNYPDVCVRPALQIKNLKFSNLEIEDIFEIGGYKFKIISENLAWMYKQNLGYYVFNESLEDGNDYETSNVKKIVDKWYEALSNKNTEHNTIVEFMNSKEYRDFLIK